MRGEVIGQSKARQTVNIPWSHQKRYLVRKRDCGLVVSKVEGYNMYCKVCLRSRSVIAASSFEHDCTLFNLLYPGYV